MRPVLRRRHLNSATVTLTNSTVSGNEATTTAAASPTTGTATLTNSTVSGNEASIDGGGIYNQEAAVTLTNSTISGNEAETYGGGISNHGISHADQQHHQRQ